MNQRKMFDEELDEMTIQHSTAIDKLKRMHSDDKGKMEQLLHQYKENTDNAGGTKKDPARCLEKCMTFTNNNILFQTYFISELMIIFREPLLVNVFNSAKHTVTIPLGKIIFRDNKHLS